MKKYVFFIFIGFIVIFNKQIIAPINFFLSNVMNEENKKTSIQIRLSKFLWYYSVKKNKTEEIIYLTRLLPWDKNKDFLNVDVFIIKNPKKYQTTKKVYLDECSNKKIKTFNNYKIYLCEKDNKKYLGLIFLNKENIIIFFYDYKNTYDKYINEIMNNIEFK